LKKLGNANRLFLWYVKNDEYFLESDTLDFLK